MIYCKINCKTDGAILLYRGRERCILLDADERFLPPTGAKVKRSFCVFELPESVQHFIFPPDNDLLLSPSALLTDPSWII